MTKEDSYIRISEIIYNSLHDDITQEEQEMLNCWLKDEGHLKFFMNLKNTNSLYEDLLEMQYMDTNLAFEQMNKRLNRRNRQRLFGWLSGVAAILALGVGTWLWMDKQPQTTEKPQFVAWQMPAADLTILSTAEGETVVLADSINAVDANRIEAQLPVRKTVFAEKTVIDPVHYNVLSTSSRGNISVILYDSTRVWLNAGSELRYPERFAENVREVYVKGEAYFEVARDTNKPFIVRTAGGEVEVLGTHFNVLAPAQGAWVTTLVQGCVKIRNTRNDSVIVYPGQQVIAQAQGTMDVQTVDTRYYTAWQKNLFAFRDETLYHIMTALAEWYDFNFDIQSIELANIRFTTMIEKFPNVNDVLEILKRTDKFSFTQNPDGRIVIRK